MTLTNINRAIEDPFNRYKMPKLVVQVIKERSSFRTILVNLSDIGKALRRSPQYIIKYLALELNSSMKVNNHSNQYIILGNYNPETLQNVLDGFIKLFVLCKTCENPETDLDCDEKGLCQRCCACGSTREITIECHELVKFIRQNWSEDEKKKNQYYWNQIISFPEEIDEISSQSISSDEDWDDDDDEQFVALFQRKKLSDQLNDLVSIEELINEAKRLNMTTKAPCLIARNLFTKEILKEIDVYEVLLSHFCQNHEQQYSLLDGIAMFICSNEEIHEIFSNEKQISTIFYKLYEKDLIDEDVFYDWSPIEQFRRP
ncbi:unnamed protein product [Adineta ricciae]|uniref:Eukaryotic translation initiation factor 5 n=1 Tax=Adineta ricciae TaxID=249248 RepID=A0A815NV80_ADIRI|nr:unnamed protein product [Adineta ricciae]CAF1465687.1 unnamed protein product [Adineta ricciae]